MHSIDYMNNENAYTTIKCHVDTRQADMFTYE